ncbi:MAG: hypothetical protein KAQ98_13190 [Bacteriovoracaceae bacterium]|nr:hypothetical protein [Bacteriovoracaceae bacterium]
MLRGRKIFIFIFVLLSVAIAGCIQAPPKSKTQEAKDTANTTPNASIQSGSQSFSESVGSISVQVSLDRPSTYSVSIPWRIVNTGSTPASTAFLSTSGSITIAPGYRVQTISLIITDDTTFEYDEDVYVEILSPSNANLGSNTHALKVVDDDSYNRPTLYFSSSSQNVIEGAAVTVCATTSLSKITYKTVDIPYIVYGTADSGDHDLINSVATIAAGQSETGICFNLVNNEVMEPLENVVIELLTPADLIAGSPLTHTVYIYDDETKPIVDFESATFTATEDVVTILATVTLNATSTLNTDIVFSLGGSADTNVDYTATTTMTINAGDISGTSTFTIINDTTDEIAETITYTIDSVQMGTIGSTNSMTITLLDDDAPSELSFSSSSQIVTEGDLGYTYVTVPVVLDKVSGFDISLDFSISGTASDNYDFTNFPYLTSTTTGSFSISAGESSGSFSFYITGDEKDEFDETIVITFATSTIVNATATSPYIHTVTIADDEDEPEIYFTTSEAYANEGTATRYVTAYINAESEKLISVDFAPITGTASSGQPDYTLPEGTILTFNPGETATSLPVTISASGDGIEDAETIIFEIINTTNAVPNTSPSYYSTYTLTVADMDLPPVLGFTSTYTQVREDEEDEGSDFVKVYMETDKINGEDITFDILFSGTASYNGDYKDFTYSASQFTISAGSTSTFIGMTTIDDIYMEATESIVMTFTNVTSNATVIASATDTCTIDILPSDSTRIPEINFDDPAGYTVIEQTGATHSLDIVVRLDMMSGMDTEAHVTIDTANSIATASPSAVADFDWPGSITGTGTIYIPAYSTTAALTIDIIADSFDDPDSDYVRLVLDATDSLTLGSDDFTYVYITDDDASPDISFENVSWNATEGITMATTVALSAFSGRDITVPLTIDGASTATATQDYTFTATTLLIPAGYTSFTTTTFLIVDDALDENNETLLIEMGAVDYATISGSDTMTISIIDNDAEPSIAWSASAQSITEGTNASEANDTIITATITLTATSGRDVTVVLSASISSTADSSDYSGGLGIITMPAGVTQTSTSIIIRGDSLNELDEIIILDMGTPVWATIGATNDHTITIFDDDAQPSVSFETSTASYVEGSTYTTTVSLSATSGLDITVDLTYDATASIALDGGIDHNFITETVTIPAGSIAAASTGFTIVADGLFEVDESFVVQMGNPVNSATASPATFTATIVNADASPTAGFSVESQVVAEGPAVPTYSVTFSLSATSGADTILYYAVNPGITTAQTPADYTFADGSVTIPAGTTLATKSLTINDEAAVDPGELIYVQIYNIVNAATGTYDAQTIYIDDDETTSSVSFDATTQNVTESGTVTVTFVINEPITTDVTITYGASVGSTASASGVDHNFVGGSLVIPAGDLSLGTTFLVTTDTLDEDNETIIVEILAAAGTSISSPSTHTITINDDDSSPTVYFLTPSQTVYEGDVIISATVSLTEISGRDVTVPYTFNVSSTATSTGTNPDHDLVEGNFIIAEGSLTQTVTFNVISDILDEDDETIIIDMGTPVGADAGIITQHTVTITDITPEPVVEFASIQQTSAENAGTIAATITLTASSGKTITIPYTLDAGSTATSGTDHDLASSGNISIPSGTSTYLLTIAITDDGSDEWNENFEIKMGTPNNATLGTNSEHNIIITDDDAEPTVSFTSTTSSINENSGNIQIEFTVSITSGKQITIPFTVDPTSTASDSGIDHNLVAGSVIVPAGNPTAQTEVITITNDYLTEGDETIVVVAGTPTNAATASPATHTLTIRDDDDMKPALGYEHTCVVIDGAAKCWGDNSSGQLGQGNTDNYGDDESAIPANINIGTGLYVTDISAGAFHTCALVHTGYVKCWGENGSGQLGLGDTDNRGDDTNEMGDNLSYVDLGSALTAKSIVAGDYHTCAFLSNDSIKCWGSNSSGQLGQPEVVAVGYASNQMGNYLSDLSTIGLSGIPNQISAGQNHTCATFIGNTTKCWGENGSGQLGIDDTTDKGKTDGDLASLSDIDLGGTSVSYVISGRDHNCIHSQGANEIKCWGNNTFNQLGLADTMNRGDGVTFTASPGVAQNNNIMSELPALPMPVGRIAETVASGDDHTCMLMDDNNIKCWGDNTFGQMGLDHAITFTGSTPATATNVAGTSGTDLSSGGDHNCVIVDTRELKCWGRNNKGQLLQGDTDHKGDEVGEMAGDITNIIFP